MENIDEMGSIDAQLAAQPRVSRSSEAFSKYNMTVDEKQIEGILEKAAKDSVGELCIETLKRIVSCIDLTTLTPLDTQESVLSLVEKVNDLDDRYPDIPGVASICVYPLFAQIVSKSIQADGVRTCCVAGAFPSAQTFQEVKIAEVGLAIHDGAQEIDTVLNPGLILAGDFETASQDIDEIKDFCGEHTLKVILETGALKTLDNVKKAALTAMYSGADFIKTSTGKEVPGADPKSFCTMCLAIKEYHALTGRRVGIKAAGGIRETSQAVLYYTIVKNVLGKDWLTPELFRIGASSLLDKLLAELYL